MGDLFADDRENRARGGGGRKSKYKKKKRQSSESIVDIVRQSNFARLSKKSLRDCIQRRLKRKEGNE